MSDADGSAMQLRVQHLPAGWKRVHVSAIAEVRLGRQRSPEKAAGKHQTPYLRAANVTWRGLDLSDVKMMNFEGRELPAYQLRSGDVLLAEASGSPGEVGKPAIWNDEIPGACFQNTLIRVRSERVYPRYLYYHFLSDALSGRFINPSRGVGIHHLGAAGLSNHEIALAPDSNQKSVVEAIEAHFTQLDAAVVALQRVRANLKRYRASVLKAACGGMLMERRGTYRPARLGDLKAFSMYGPRFSSDAYSAAGRLVLRTTDISESGKVSLLDAPRIELSDDEFARYKVEVGDLLITRTGSLGTLSVFNDSVDAIPGAYLIQYRLNTAELSPSYAFCALMSPAGQQRLKGSGAGVGRPNLNVPSIDDIPILLPSVAEQGRIVAEVERRLSVADALATEVAAGLKRCARMRQAILKKAFEGRLVLDLGRGPS